MTSMVFFRYLHAYEHFELGAEGFTQKSCNCPHPSIMNRQIKLQSESVSVCVFDRVSHFKKRCLHYLMAELLFAEYNYVFRRSARAIVIGDHGSLTLVCVDRDVCV